jgi:hypothetical protein
MEFLQRNEKVKKKAGGSKKWGIAVPRESKTT